MTNRTITIKPVKNGFIITPEPEGYIRGDMIRNNEETMVFETLGGVAEFLNEEFPDDGTDGDTTVGAE